MISLPLMPRIRIPYCLLLAVTMFITACRADRIVPDEPNPDILSSLGDELVFDDKSLPEITVSFTLNQWNAFLQAYDQDSQTKQYVPCVYCQIQQTPQQKSRGVLHYCPFLRGHARQSGGSGFRSCLQQPSPSRRSRLQV